MTIHFFIYNIHNIISYISKKKIFHSATDAVNIMPLYRECIIKINNIMNLIKVSNTQFYIFIYSISTLIYDIIQDDYHLFKFM